MFSTYNTAGHSPKYIIEQISAIYIRAACIVCFCAAYMYSVHSKLTMLTTRQGAHTHSHNICKRKCKREQNMTETAVYRVTAHKPPATSKKKPFRLLFSQKTRSLRLRFFPRLGIVIISMQARNANVWDEMHNSSSSNSISSALWIRYAIQKTFLIQSTFRIKLRPDPPTNFLTIVLENKPTQGNGVATTKSATWPNQLFIPRALIYRSHARFINHRIRLQYMV